MTNDILPKEEDTIAAKRANRISQKLGMAGHRVFSGNNWWSNYLVEIGGLALILGLNFNIISPFLDRVDSGTPFSGPIIPALASGLNFLAQIPFYRGVQIVDTIFFLIFPISFYIFVRFISGRRLTALLAALFATLPEFMFAKVRIIGGLLDGDGPHIAALGLTLLAVYGLLSFLRQGGIRQLIVAALLSSLILLISPFGFLTYVIMAAIAAFSEVLLGSGRLKIFRAIAVFILTWALVSFWYNPAFVQWMIFGPWGKELRVMVSQILPISFFVVPILGTFGFLLFDRRPNLQPIFLAVFWTISFSIIILVGSGKFLSTNSSRYWPELGMAIAYLLSLTVVWIIDRLKTVRVPFIPKLNRPALSNPVIALVLIILTLTIILPRENGFAAEGQMAAPWDNMERGRLWLAKDNFDGIFGYIGYGITLTSLIVLLMVNLVWGKKLSND